MKASIPNIMYKPLESLKVQKPLKSSLTLMKPGDITFVRYKESNVYKLGLIYMSTENSLLIVDVGINTKSKTDPLWKKQNFNIKNDMALKMSTETNDKLLDLHEKYHKIEKNDDKIMMKLNNSHKSINAFVLKNNMLYKMKKDGSIFKSHTQIEEVIFVH